MGEILVVVAAVWGGSFFVAMTWFSVDEWKYRRSMAPHEQVETSASEVSAPATTTDDRRPAMA